MGFDIRQQKVICCVVLFSQAVESLFRAGMMQSVKTQKQACIETGLNESTMSGRKKEDSKYWEEFRMKYPNSNLS